MILTLDIGNTNIKTALFDGKEMRYYWRMSTNIQKSSDEYGIVLVNLFQHVGVRPEEVEGIMISSVVPTINFTIEHMCQNYFGQTPLFVVPGIKTGINIRYENPRELGSDRIANAVAAYEEYGAPTIFIDFGTTTTFGVVGEGGVFLGGCICPGVKLASEALVTGTAKLPRFELTKPEHVIGRTTLTNLQSGMYYGYVGLVKNIVRKIKQELGQEATVVATGGMAVMIAEESNTDDLFEHAVDAAVQNGLVHDGELVVLTAGVPLGISGTTNLMKVHVVGHLLSRGQGLHGGKVIAPLCVIRNLEKDAKDFNTGDVIVCHQTTREMFSMLRKSSAIVLEDDNPEGHGAIAGMSLDIPVIIGAKNATNILKSGAVVTVDGEKGTVSAN